MNKLTLNKGRVTACLMLMCLFLAQACRKDLLQPNSKDLQNGISIAEAKAYFDSNLQKSNKPEKLMSIKGAANEMTFDNVLANKKALWDQAYQKIISGANTVKVPIDFGRAQLMVGKDAYLPFGALNYLFMYKDSLQTIRAEWVILMPDSAWLYGSRLKYTGNIIVKNWEGKFLKEYQFNNSGIDTKQLSTSQIKRLSSLNKLQTGEDEQELKRPSGPICLRFSTGKCPKQRPRCTEYRCDMCLELCAVEKCGILINEKDPDWPGGIDGDGGGGGKPAGSGPGGSGGGGYVPDDCNGGRQIPHEPANNNPDPNANSIPLPPCIPKLVKLDINLQDFIPIPTAEELEPIFLPNDFDIHYPQEYFDIEDSYDALALELIQQGVPNTDPIPEAYYINGTKIDMAGATPLNGKRTALGFPSNHRYFWKELIKLRPEMFDADNRAKILAKGSPIANDQWIKYNPTHKAYRNLPLRHHHEGQGRYAYAIPEKVHLKWNRILHTIRNGKFPGLKGTMNSLAGGMQIF